MSTSKTTSTPARAADPTHRPRRRDNGRLVAATAVGALVTLFAVLNTGDVEVNWILGSWSTPLIVVIAVSFLLGAAVGWLARVRRSVRRAKPR